MVFRTLIRYAGKRVPLIKFRKGGYPQAGGSAGPAAAATSSSKSASSEPKPIKPSPKKAKGEAIEDWELQPRYWRKQIDPVEMDYINRGGPA